MPIAPPPPPPPFPNSALLLKRSIGTNTVLYRYPEEDLIHAHQQSSEEEAGEGEGVVSTDYIIIKNLTVHTVTGLDEWGRDRRLQPILISLSVHTDLSGVGAHDVLTDSLSYGTLSKKVKSFTESTACITVEGLALSIAKYCFGEFAMIQEITVKVEKPKGHLYAEGAGAQITRTRKDMEIEEALFKEYEGKINLESGLLPLSWKERMDANVDMDFIFLKNLTIHTIIGCNPWERGEKQKVIVNLIIYPRIPFRFLGNHVYKPHNYRTIARTVTKYVESSTYKTVEALATSMARLCVEKCDVGKITVRVEKPNALLFAQTAGIEITRDRAFFEKESPLKDELISTERFEYGYAPKTRVITPRRYSSKEADVTEWQQQTERIKEDPQITVLETSFTKIMTPFSTYASSLDVISQTITAKQRDLKHVVYIALGSNMGDRAENIINATLELEKTLGAQVVDSSFMYETPACYVTDQPSFLNAVCKIRTDLEPEALLTGLKKIEATIGRTPTFRWGPRIVDLDILFYDHLIYKSETLEIPHPRIQEREFVLIPLCDIAKDFEHPALLRSCTDLLQLLRHTREVQEETTEELSTPIRKVLPLRRNRPPFFFSTHDKPVDTTRLLSWDDCTFVMGIVNTTPDSFSDGGDHFYNKTSDVTRVVETVVEMVQEGNVDIIDIGGQSTRPGAEEVTAQEEVSRVLPLIRAIRSHEIEAVRTIPISIDTFRACVAEEAILAGADIINDVTGGERDDKMISVMAKYQVPVVLMHSRGDSKTMTLPEMKKYESGVVDGIKYELAKRVTATLDGGVRRWSIIVDPGIGFAKDVEQNLEVLRHASEFGNLDSVTVNAESKNNNIAIANTMPTPAASPLMGKMSLVTERQLQGFPTLLGPSRKSFIGKITQVAEPKKRMLGTAAACTACIAGGVNVLRVHDVKEMKEVVRMADAIWKSKKH